MSAVLTLRGLRPGARTPARQQASDAALLFDAPGPRGRRRIAITSALATVALAGLLAAGTWQLWRAGQLEYPSWRYFLGQSIVRYLAQALGDTLAATAVGAGLSFPLGVALGWLRLSRHRWLRLVVGTWIDAMRAVPMLLLIYFFLLAVPRWGLTLPSFWMLTIPIVMCVSATDTALFGDDGLGLDSVDALELGLAVQKTFGLQLDSEQTQLRDHFESVTSLAKFIRAQKGEA